MDTVIDLRPSRSGQVYTDGLKAWLARSAPLTIPVSLVLEHGRKDHHIPDGILRTAPRWNSLRLTRFHVRGYTPLSLISQLAGCKLESLEELNLGKFANFTENPTAVPSFTSVPQLRKLSIHFCSNALSILMPWAQLNNLTLGADFPNIALDVLGQCPNLIRADVRTAGWSVLPEASQDILILSYLQFLSLNFLGSGARHVIPFLGPLSAPALKELCLNFAAMDDFDDAWWTQAHFTAFQLRAPSITQLDLWYSSLTSDDLTTALRHAPSLTSLKVNFCPASIDDALID
ncbi:hypothetical protein B0H12DRAFT_1052090, partial [Mycena haematopus]